MIDWEQLKCSYEILYASVITFCILVLTHMHILHLKKQLFISQKRRNSIISCESTRTIDKRRPNLCSPLSLCHLIHRLACEFSNLGGMALLGQLRVRLIMRPEIVCLDVTVYYANYWFVSYCSIGTYLSRHSLELVSRSLCKSSSACWNTVLYTHKYWV